MPHHLLQREVIKKREVRLSALEKSVTGGVQRGREEYQREKEEIELGAGVERDAGLLIVVRD